MECPICGCTRVQYRSKNNKTLITKYKCLDCQQIFEISDDTNKANNMLISEVAQLKDAKKRRKHQGDTNENRNYRRFTSVL